MFTNSRLQPTDCPAGHTARAGNKDISGTYAGEGRAGWTCYTKSSVTCTLSSSESRTISDNAYGQGRSYKGTAITGKTVKAGQHLTFGCVDDWKNARGQDKINVVCQSNGRFNLAVVSKCKKPVTCTLSSTESRTISDNAYGQGRSYKGTAVTGKTVKQGQHLTFGCVDDWKNAHGQEKINVVCQSNGRFNLSGLSKCKKPVVCTLSSSESRTISDNAYGQGTSYQRTAVTGKTAKEGHFLTFGCVDDWKNARGESKINVVCQSNGRFNLAVVSLCKRQTCTLSSAESRTISDNAYGQGSSYKRTAVTGKTVRIGQHLTFGCVDDWKNAHGQEKINVVCQSNGRFNLAVVSKCKKPVVCTLSSTESRTISDNAYGQGSSYQRTAVTGKTAKEGHFLTFGCVDDWKNARGESKINVVCQSNGRFNLAVVSKCKKPVSCTLSSTQSRQISDNAYGQGHSYKRTAVTSKTAKEGQSLVFGCVDNWVDTTGHDTIKVTCASNGRFDMSSVSRCRKPKITCRFTIDNYAVGVKYNNRAVSVSALTTDWDKVKTFSFEPVNGAHLEIIGYEASTCNGCGCSGLQLECDNGFISTNERNVWTAMGKTSSINFGERFTNSGICQSTSGFSLSGAKLSPMKIWPANGSKYAYFKAVPYWNRKCSGSFSTCNSSCKSVFTPESGSKCHVAKAFRTCTHGEGSCRTTAYSKVTVSFTQSGSSSVQCSILGQIVASHLPSSVSKPEVEYNGCKKRRLLSAGEHKIDVILTYKGVPTADAEKIEKMVTQPDFQKKVLNKVREHPEMESGLKMLGAKISKPGYENVKMFDAIKAEEELALIAGMSTAVFVAVICSSVTGLILIGVALYCFCKKPVDHDFDEGKTVMPEV